jgi:hypothetical protein
MRLFAHSFQTGYSVVRFQYAVNAKLAPYGMTNKPVPDVRLILHDQQLVQSGPSFLTRWEISLGSRLLKAAIIFDPAIFFIQLPAERQEKVIGKEKLIFEMRDILVHPCQLHVQGF